MVQDGTICIAHISHNHTTGGGVLFSSWCTFYLKKRPFWTFFAILSCICAFLVYFLGVTNAMGYQNGQI